MPARRSVHWHGKSELKARPAVIRTLHEELRRLGASLRAVRERSGLTQQEAAERIGLHVKHLQRLERGAANATLSTLVACALAFRISPVALLAGPPDLPEPFEQLDSASAQPFRNSIPLYSLRAVAGRFGAFQQVEPLAWVRPRGRTRPAAGLFVAQVVGESMNRRIPSGSFCVFRAPAVAPLSGKIVLAQHRGVADPEQGGQYTIKFYRASGREVRLEPLSSSRRHRPAIFRGTQLEDLSVLAERTRERIVIFTAEQLRTARQSEVALADRVKYRGEQFEVESVEAWAGYYRCIGAKVEEQVDWPKIEDALHAWLKGATSVTCIWAEQSGPQPKPPYCTLRIEGPRRLGGADELRQEADGHDVRQLAVGQRELTVQCQAFTAGTNGQATARELLTKAQARLSLPAMQEQLADVGLAVIDEGNVQNVSTVLETKWQGRAALDVRFGCADSAEERVGSIESVEFVGP